MKAFVQANPMASLPYFRQALFCADFYQHILQSRSPFNCIVPQSSILEPQFTEGHLLLSRNHLETHKTLALLSTNGSRGCNRGYIEILTPFHVLGLEELLQCRDQHLDFKRLTSHIKATITESLFSRHDKVSVALLNHIVPLV
jgi:hypothetical protein